MPRVLHDGPTGTMIEDDLGNVLTLPPGIAAGGLPTGSPPPAPAPSDDLGAHLPGMLSAIHGVPIPAPAPAPTPPAAPAVPPLGFSPPPGAGGGSGGSRALGGVALPPVPDAITGADHAAAAPAPTPDAISGAAPIAPRAASAPGPGASAAPTDPHEAAARAVEQAGQARADLADEQSRELAKRNARMDELQARADAKAAERQAWIADRERKYDAIIDEHANFKIHEDTRPGWQKVLGAISIALSGLGQALKGDGAHNPALEMIQSALRENVRQQLAERDKLLERAGALGQQIQRARAAAGDDEAGMYRLMMAGESERAARAIEASAARYASPQAKAEAERQAALLRQDGKKYAADQAASEWERRENARKLDEQIAARKAQIALGYYGISSENRRADLNRAAQGSQFWFDAALRASQQKIDNDLKAGKLTLDAAKAQREQLEGHAIGGAPRVVRDADGKPVIGADGVPQIAHDLIVVPYASASEIPKLREQKAAVDQVSAIVDDMVRGIKEHGGESDFLKSADWQRIQSQKATLLNELRKGYDMGTLDKGALEIAEQMLGGVDPASFVRNASPGLIAARDTMVAKFNAGLRAGGYEGPAYKPPDLTDLPGATSSTSDRGFRDLIDRVPGKAYPGATDWGQFDAGAPGADRGYDDEQRALVLHAANLAASDAVDGGARQTARTQLATIASSAASPGLRELAKDALQRVDAGAWAPVSGVVDPSEAAAKAAAARVLDARQNGDAGSRDYPVFK